MYWRLLSSLSRREEEDIFLYHPFFLIASKQNDLFHLAPTGKGPSLLPGSDVALLSSMESHPYCTSKGSSYTSHHSPIDTHSFIHCKVIRKTHCSQSGAIWDENMFALKHNDRPSDWSTKRRRRNGKRLKKTN